MKDGVSVHVHSCGSIEFGKVASILRTLDRGCSDRSGVLRQNGGGGGDCVVIGIKKRASCITARGAP